MSTRNLVITGNSQPSDVVTPMEALEEFYFAFNRRNLEIMRQNWASSPEIAMSNPLGGLRRGWDEVGSVYERIFNGAARVYVEYYDFDIMQTDTMFCAVGRERGWFRKGSEEIELAIRTSRIYALTDGRWRQIHHHGSIDDPALLARYQAAVQPALPQAGRA